MQKKKQDNQNKPQKYREPNKSFHQFMTKIKIYPTKTFLLIIVPENHIQKTQIILDTIHIIIQTIEDDHQPKKNHEVSHKTDIVDQTVKVISIEITIQDQIQADLNFRLISVPIQILAIEFI